MFAEIFKIVRANFGFISVNKLKLKQKFINDWPKTLIGNEQIFYSLSNLKHLLTTHKTR